MISQALSVNGAKVYITGRRAEELQKVVELYSPKSGNGQLIA
jgi:NADP-dependent 3-hydroxy acid dehydrogenase YdfG